MSFNFGFVARNKAAAKVLLAKQFAPYCVVEFVGRAIDALKETDAVSVNASGHLCEGSSYEVSTANITVQPLKFAE